uniref:Rapamycin-insensitive companion of mTOR domain-containing protein n=1 Tax=Panagrolaimus superbus TaxID=310955 RepID=A0A914Z8M0_9BILA
MEVNFFKQITVYRFLDLLTSTTSIEYVKLIVSSLNYAQRGSFSRGIFETALTSTDEVSRKWCTRFLGVLAGTRTIPDFGEWGMKLLIGQLGDRCGKVVRHAVRLLHFWLPVKKIVSSLMDETREAIENWLNFYHEEYVLIVEEDLKVALLNVKKSIKGTYARPSNEKFDKYGVPMPVHLFGQLSKHQIGRGLLYQSNISSFLLKVLIESGVSTEAEILKVKAALLSLGHIAGNLPAGYFESFLLPDTIATICRYAEECPTLSVRGTAIWSLNLVGQTEDGARQLAFLGWESNRHTHVVDEVCAQFCDQSVISSTSFRRRSRVKSLSSNIYCLDKIKPAITKCFSSTNLVIEEVSRPRSKSIEQKSFALRRILSDSHIALPIVGRKKHIKKKEKLTATKSVPYADTVRPDRTFTHESAVTSGFGSVSQEEHQQQQTKDLQQSVIVGSEYLQSPKIHRYLNQISKFQEPPTTKKREEFAPSSMRNFTNPFILPDLCEKSGEISYSFIDNELITSGMSANSFNGKPFGIERQLGRVDRELMVETEAKVQQHFSSIYRNQHGIPSFAQRTLLRIPNRTNSEVVYSFLSRSELKNLQNYREMLYGGTDWHPDDSSHLKAIGCIINWTVVALPCQIDLILKKIFKPRDADDSKSFVSPSITKHDKGSAQRCFYCQNRIQNGQQITHYTAIDSSIRNDILRFVSLFEIRGNFIQRQLLKQYGDDIQKAFENPCLYSDVIELMTELNLNSQSRKQLHKLFSEAFILK